MRKKRSTKENAKSKSNWTRSKTRGRRKLTKLHPSVEEELRLGREIMAEYRETLAALAKS